MGNSTFQVIDQGKGQVYTLKERNESGDTVTRYPNYITCNGDKNIILYPDWLDHKEHRDFKSFLIRSGFKF